MSSKRKEYKVDACAKKAALFFLACEPNPVTRLSISAAMKAKGYSDAEAADRILVQQVHSESQKNKSNDTPRPESAATSSLLTLATVATAVSSRGIKSEFLEISWCGAAHKEMPHQLEGEARRNGQAGS